MEALKKFKKEKENFLSKPDKSRKKSFDEKIENLIKKINEREGCYTTSSCSGRLMIYIPKDKKNETEWSYVSHDLVNEKDILDKQGENAWLKVEGPILHICCLDINEAIKIVNFFRNSGWKKTSIISLKPKIIVEASTSIIINQPFNNLNEEYIKNIVEEANKKLKRGWELIGRAEKNLEKLN